MGASSIEERRRPWPDVWQRAYIKVPLFAAAGILSFHLAFWFPALAPLILVYAVSLASLCFLSTGRAAFRIAFFIGLLAFAPHLLWFWKIFGFAAICLWAVLSFFQALYALLLHQWRIQFGARYLSLVQLSSGWQLNISAANVTFSGFRGSASGIAFLSSPVLCHSDIWESMA